MYLYIYIHYTMHFRNFFEQKHFFFISQIIKIKNNLSEVKSILLFIHSIYRHFKIAVTSTADIERSKIKIKTFHLAFSKFYDLTDAKKNMKKSWY